MCVVCTMAAKIAAVLPLHVSMSEMGECTIWMVSFFASVVITKIPIALLVITTSGQSNLT